jgi:hypothetical protein
MEKNIMDKEDKILELTRRIRILEWDKKQHQIHFALNRELEECKKELSLLLVGEVTNVQMQ